MTMEKMAFDTTKAAVEKAAKVVEMGVKKAWSILDAASEKKAPGEVLSSNGVKAVQGVSKEVK